MVGTAGCNVLTHEHIVDHDVEISAKNVPAGTYYADLLIQLPETDKLRVPDTGLRLDGADITDDSEIFRYDTDHYVSASLHYGYADSFSFAEAHDPDMLCTVLHLSGDTAKNRFSKGKEFLLIPSFRVAYVSQDGKVLGVTDPAEKEPNSVPYFDIPFTADGSAVRYDYTMGDDWDPFWTVIAIESAILSFFAVIAVPVCAIAGIVRLIRRRKKPADHDTQNESNGDDAS